MDAIVFESVMIDHEHLCLDSFVDKVGGYRRMSEFESGQSVNTLTKTMNEIQLPCGSKI